MQEWVQQEPKLYALQDELYDLFDLHEQYKRDALEESELKERLLRFLNKIAQQIGLPEKPGNLTGGVDLDPPRRFPRRNGGSPNRKPFSEEKEKSFPPAEEDSGASEEWEDTPPEEDWEEATESSGGFEPPEELSEESEEDRRKKLAEEEARKKASIFEELEDISEDLFDIEDEESEEAAETSAPDDDWHSKGTETAPPAPPQAVEPDPAPEPPAAGPTPAVGPQATPTGDLVNISVYAPEEVQPAAQFLMTVFAHLFEQREEVDAMAKEADPTASRQARKSLNAPIQRGESLLLRLQIADWQIDEPVQQMTWFGFPNSVEYIISVPQNATGTVFGTLIVSNQRGPVGRIKFNLQVQGMMVPRLMADPTPAQEASLYQQVYLAYVPEDKALIEEKKQAMQAMGLQLLETPPEADPHTWEEKMVLQLHEAELYYLFWSKACQASPLIPLSWERALGFRYSHPKGLPDIIPVSLEENAPPPPRDLAMFAFEELQAKPALRKPIDPASLPQDPQALQQHCEMLLATGRKEVFDILFEKLQTDQQALGDLMLNQSRWVTLQRQKRMKLITEEQARTELAGINFAVIELIRLLK